MWLWAGLLGLTLVVLYGLTLFQVKGFALVREQWAGFLGLASAVSGTVQFLPQVIETLTTRVLELI